MDVVTVHSVVDTSIAKDSKGPVISLLSVIKCPQNTLDPDWFTEVLFKLEADDSWWLSLNLRSDQITQTQP